MTLSRLLSGYMWVNTWYSLYKQGLQHACLSSDSSTSVSVSTSVPSSSSFPKKTLDSDMYDQHQYSVNIAIQQVDLRLDLTV